MGIYVNPGYAGFEEVRRDIYVDKTGLIAHINSLIGKPKPLVSFSRPRRFGKSYDAKMLCAYYDKSCDSHFLFDDLQIAEQNSYEEHLNKYNVISLDVTGFITESDSFIGGDGKGSHLVADIRTALLEELKETFPGCIADDEQNLAKALYAVVSKGNAKFVFVIDEWDALFREFKDNQQLQKDYILFLRSLFKNSNITPRVVAAAYMTGILPIKKYGTESALSDFQEYTMTKPLIMAEYVGFTERDVQKLCNHHGMDYDEIKQWYDGYSFDNLYSIYSPYSVMSAIRYQRIENYWKQSESFESLKSYIEENFDGLKGAIIMMLGGQSVKIDIDTFKNDIISYQSKDDVLTLLIHLGYLTYDCASGKVHIPNREVAEVFQSATKGKRWEPVTRAIRQSEKLLEATISGDSEQVASALELVHEECTSVLEYNDENSLACAIYIAYYTARNYYKIIRELPAGKGFADYAFFPVKGTDKPAMIIELKYDKDADSAIKQIHDNRYAGALKDYFGKMVLVGINYDKDAKGVEAKKHSCVIERI